MITKKLLANEKVKFDSVHPVCIPEITIRTQLMKVPAVYELHTFEKFYISIPFESLRVKS